MKGTDRKQWILDAALKSFAMFGYKATTMEQVAKIAKVGKGTIYTFFTTKEQLFDEIIHQVIMEMKELADHTIDRNLPFLENLHRVLYGMLDFREKHELTIRLSYEVQDMGTPMAKEGMLKVEKAIRAYIQKEIERAIERREIKECDPQVTAFVILKLYVALVSDWSKTNEPLSKEQISGIFKLYLAEGLEIKT
ncbi:TetR/AcrR family transcriptional regulator [Marinicrinis lubricantis]|uniref:TetR/AcrR family transcriptional regulator n=1 Tax=Marinicrinis lubricantis TaxID=2086470 RepID=A0ABW1IK77_9BACL